MGLINNDTYVAPYGVQITGAYISFAGETLYLRQSGAGSYSINANYRIYWNQECRETGLSYVDLKSVSASVASSELSGNLYNILYEALKVIYPNTSDEVRKAPASVPVSDVPSAPVSDVSAPSK